MMDPSFRALAIVKLLLSLVGGHAPLDRVGYVADAIASATERPSEQAALAWVAWRESRFGQSSDLWWGVMRCRGWPGCTPFDEARRAVGALRGAAGFCGTAAWDVRLSRYHHGQGCAVDAYGAAGARRVPELVARTRAAPAAEASR